MQKSIYITYNPDSRKEEELALDLYNKGWKNGFIVNLPYRPANVNLSQRNVAPIPNQQTKLNIDSAHWVLVFSTENLSDTVRQEIDYAMGKKGMNRIIVVYSSERGANISFTGDNRPIEVFINDYDVNRIEQFKEDIFQMISERNQDENRNNNNALAAILGIGAAILLFREILRDNR